MSGLRSLGLTVGSVSRTTLDQLTSPGPNPRPVTRRQKLALRGALQANARLVLDVDTARKHAVVAAGAIDTLKLAPGTSDPHDLTIPSTGWIDVPTNQELPISDQRAWWGYYATTDNVADVYVETAA